MDFRNRSRPKGLASALLSKLERRPAVKSRRLVPFIDGLESRIAPAVAGNLFVVGTTLVYNGNFANNNVIVSGTDSAFGLTDSAGTINSTVPGMSDSALSGSTAVIPSYIQTIAIQGQNGTDVINVTSLSTTRNVILAGTTVNINGALVADNVTVTGTLVSLTGDSSITTDGAGPIAGSVTINGTLDNSSSASAIPYAPTINTSSTLDGNVTFNGLVVGTTNLIVDAGSGGNVTALQSINLGGTAGFAITGSTDASIGANTVDLHQIVDGSTGLLVNADGAVNVNGNVVSTGPVVFAANLDDAGPQGFTQVSGSIITTATTGGFPAGPLGSAVDIFVNAYPDPSAAVVGTGTGGASIAGLTTGSGGNVFITTGNSYALNGVTPLNGGGPIQSSPQYSGRNVSTGTGGLYAVSGAGGINLTTSVASLEVGDFSPAPSGGNVTIANSGQALTLVNTFGIATQATNGNVSISNSLNLTVGSTASAASVVEGGSGHSITLTTTNPTSTSGVLSIAGSSTVGSSADTVNFNTSGDITDPATGLVTATKLNIVAGSGATSFEGSVGTSADPLLVTSGSGSPVTVNVTTTTATNGINISSPATGGSPITVTGATAQTGVINLTTTGANDLVVNGFVANNDGSAITLSSGQNIIVNSGSITSGSGLITLTPGTLTTGTAGNVTIAAGTTVATGGSLVVSSSVATGTGAVDNIHISGTLAATGDITINGATGAVPVTLGISGTIAATGTTDGVTIDTDLGTGVQVLNIGGNIASGTDGVTIETGGSATAGVILSTTGTITSTGNFTITPLAAANISLNLSGSINSGGVVSFNGGTIAAGAVVLTNSGSITGAGSVYINDYAGADAFLMTNTGSITGGTITIEGTNNATNTYVLGGSLTATTAVSTVSIYVTDSADASSSDIIVSGKTTVPSGDFFWIEGSSAATDNMVVTPSTTAAFMFLASGSAQTLQINTAIGNILSAPASQTTATTTMVVFTPASGLLTWQKNDSTGTITITPSVP